MNSRTLLPISAVSICAAALVGCEWGGVHSGESWNDAYSWANFSGTYKLVSTVAVDGGSSGSSSSDSSGSSSGSSGSSSSSSGSSSGSSGSGGSSGSSSSSSTTEVVTKTKTVTAKLTYKPTKILYQTNLQNLLEGSVVVGLGNGFVDQGGGVLKYNGNATGISGTVDYATGAITLTVLNAIANQWNGTTFQVSGNQQYTTTQTINHSLRQSSGKETRTTNNGDGTVTTTTTTSTTSATGTSYTTTSVTSSYIKWLNLTQKGNLLTFEDNNGLVYSGKITGASCPTANEEGYVQAGHIRFTFEATCTSNSRLSMTGSLSGDWSGSTSETTGTIANRTIDASYHGPRGASQFQAVSGSTTVSPRVVTPVAGVTE